MRLSIGKSVRRPDGIQTYMPRLYITDEEMLCLGVPDRVKIEGTAEKGFRLYADDNGLKLCRAGGSSHLDFTFVFSANKHGFNRFDRSVPAGKQLTLETELLKSGEKPVFSIASLPKQLWAKQEKQIPLRPFSNETVQITGVVTGHDVEPAERPLNGEKDVRKLIPVEEVQAESIPATVDEELRERETIGSYAGLKSVKQLHLYLEAWAAARKLKRLRAQLGFKEILTEDGDVEILLPSA